MKTTENRATRDDIARELVAVCGGYNAAIRAIVSASRLLWEYAQSPQRLAHERKSTGRRADYQPIVGDTLEAILSGSLPRRCAGALRRAMILAGMYEPQRPVQRIKPILFNPRAFARTVLGSLRTDADLRYATMRAIRLHYELPLSERTVHYLGELAQSICALLSTQSGADDTIHLSLSEIEEWRRCFADRITEEGRREDRKIRLQAVRRLTECFLEACRAVGYLSVSWGATEVQFRTPNIDSEHLVSHLFGVPTNVQGLDQLFGGGGLVLPEVLSSPSTDPLGLHRHPLPARIIVVVGARGTGKSILAAQLATEIGMRGGVSWLMPLEQAPEECLFTLETMGTLRAPNVNVALDFASAATALDTWHEDRGALVILRPEERPSVHSRPGIAPAELEREILTDFLATVRGTARSLSCGNVRLVVVDPLNCRIPGDDSALDHVDKRELLRNAIQDFKKAGTNVVLVVEEQLGRAAGRQEDNGSLNELLFAENLADVIVRLSITKRHNYATRHLEITKSRTQREQRGDHVFSIRSGKGVCLVPSVASVNARVRNRRPAKPSFEARFGVECVDEILGQKALLRGDVIVLRGPAGSFKTRFGLPFLLTQDNGRVGLRDDGVSLLLSARDSAETTTDLLARIRCDSGGNLAGAGSDNGSSALRIVPLPRGHVPPGAILQTIETEVEKILLEGKHLHRLMIDNTDLWDTSSPEVGEDATFAVTLVELLRGLRCTSLLVCGGGADVGGSLQGRLAGLSDCLISLDRYEFRGASRVTMRVLKSRGMQHRLEAFEVRLERGQIVGQASSSLLRMGAKGGAVEAIPIRLLFRTESELQRRYYQGLRDSVKAVVSPKTTLESQDRVVMLNPSLTSRLSAVDELQVLELDEFQVGRGGDSGPDAHPALHNYVVEQTKGTRWSEYFPRFVRHCAVGSHGDATATEPHCAVPFFANVGLLAYDRRFVRSARVENWHDIAHDCWDWERAREGTNSGGHDDGKLYFEHPRGTGENFNCLFFEILLSLGEAGATPEGECPIRAWLLSSCGARAAALLGILCRRAYRVRGGRDDASYWEAGRTKTKGNEFRVDSDALVYRHWYSTLNAMFYEMAGSEAGAEKASHLSVEPLPGRVSVSGEWYLGIPSYSAAPHAGMGLIEAMTTPEAELTRARLGVGLPTRSGYYAGSEGSRRLAISPYFDMDSAVIGSLVEGAFSRSGFRCYEHVSQILAHHLKRLVESSPGPEGSFTQALACGEDMARKTLASLCEELDFVQNVGCSRSSKGSGGVCEWVDVCRRSVAGHP